MTIPGSPGRWQLATVTARWAQTATAVSIRLRLDRPIAMLAGQYFVVRLTAPDGYRAQRSYSVASAPGGDTIELAVERLEDGEVSGFLHDVLEVGDRIEVRGPIGTHFAWDGDTPVLGIAGGSGVVPLMAMRRAARAADTPDLVWLVVSARGPDELYFADELVDDPDVTLAYTRTVPAGHRRPAGRLSLADLVPLVDLTRICFVCGSPAFCDTTTDLLQAAGVPVSHIRVERFGPSG